MDGSNERDGEDGRRRQDGAEDRETQAHDRSGPDGNDGQGDGCRADDRRIERHEFLREIHERIGAGEGAKEEQEQPAVEITIGEDSAEEAQD